MDLYVGRVVATIVAMVGPMTVLVLHTDLVDGGKRRPDDGWNVGWAISQMGIEEF